MSVISKMNTAAVRLFGDGNALVSLSCVYDQGLAAEGNEDVRFTKASPYGDGQLTIEKGPDLPAVNEPLYLIWSPLIDREGMTKAFVEREYAPVPPLDGAMFCFIAQVSVIHDYGYSKQVEATLGAYPEARQVPLPLRVAKERPNGSFKLGIDNPSAHTQFEPGACYWVRAYSAAKLTMDEALRLARA